MKYEFASAHEAFEFLIKKFKIKKIHMPYYLCPVMRHSAVQNNCRPIFYHIDDDFMPNKEFQKSDFILYPNYFGICDYNVDKLTDIYPNLIVDNAHAYFSKPRGFASFNSHKKFLSENQGATLQIGCAQSKSVNFSSSRREKFDFYHNKYKDTNLLNINIPEEAVPFCYPYLASSIEHADLLVEKLKAEGLTIFRYWNALPESFNEFKFYSRLVPIPLS